MLRGTSQTPRTFECEKITGAALVSMASCMTLWAPSGPTWTKHRWTHQCLERRKPGLNQNGDWRGSFAPAATLREPARDQALYAVAQLRGRTTLALIDYGGEMVTPV